MRFRTAALLLAATLGLAACQERSQRAPCPAGKVCLEYGNNAEPQTLDPQKANLVDEASVIGDLMLGLTTDSPEAKPVPGMATHCRVRS